MKTYDSYKDSGVEWIGEIPSHWMTTKIKYTAKANKESFIDGDWIESNDLSDEGVRYITTGNIGQGKYKEQGRGYISEDTFTKLDCTEVLEGDLVISRLSLPVGRSCVLPKIHYKVVTSVDNVILRPKEDIDKYFLNYLFNSTRYYEYTELISRGVTLTRISRGMLGNNPIVIPPLAEQQQIVSYLDTKTSLIDFLIEKTHQKIELLKEKRASVINETVTNGLNPKAEFKESGVEWIGEIPTDWENGKLGYYSNVFRGSGYQYLNQVDDDYEGVKERVVRISDITDFNPIWCEYKEQFENYRIKPDNILIGGTGHYFGKSIYVTKEMEGLIHSYNIIRVVIKKQYPKYVQYWLSSSNIREQMDISVLGSGQPFIDIQGLKDLQVIIPPLSEQYEIVSYLDEQTQKIDKSILKEEERTNLLKEYRQSLISSVFTGKIKVTEDAY